jgi:hypothetical protein
MARASCADAGDAGAVESDDAVDDGAGAIAGASPGVEAGASSRAGEDDAAAWTVTVRCLPVVAWMRDRRSLATLDGAGVFAGAGAHSTPGSGDGGAPVVPLGPALALGSAGTGASQRCPPSSNASGEPTRRNATLPSITTT